MKVLKRNNKVVPFDESKIESAVKRAYQSRGKEANQRVLDELAYISVGYSKDETVSVETLQDRVEQILMDLAPYDVAKAYILYREQHKESRFVRERIDYMDRYADSKDNAATSSETDPNANVTQKNVANLEGEVYKEKNRVIQRQRMKDKLHEMFPEVAKQ